MMTASLRTDPRLRWLLAPAMALVTVCTPGALLAAGPTAGAPQVEIKKHTTGKEATLTHGNREWFIHIDVDQDRTMILRIESTNGKETANQSEIVERPMSNTEVDRVINDYVSGIRSTLKP